MECSEFATLLGIIMIPAIVNMIMEEDGLGSTEAVESFYRSQTYDALARESTAVWHFSVLTIYLMWKGEMENGYVDFPEECRWMRGWLLLCTA